MRRAKGPVSPMSRFALLSLLAASTLSLTLTTSGCAAETAGDDEAGELGEDALQAKADDHWFYTGALPKLDAPTVTVSLKGHTAHVSGLLPAGVTVPALPHAKTKPENGRTRIDIVYPIATANVSIGK